MKKFMMLVGLLVLSGCVSVKEEAKVDNVKSDIVGGSLALSTGDFAYQVSIQTAWGSPFCGGTLISSCWVVTAAHCLEGESSSNIRVVAGVTDLNDQTAEVHRVSRIVSHPSYNSFQISNDIALIQLSSASSQVPALLPSLSAEAALAGTGDLATVSGWGTTSEGGFTTRQLREVEVPIVSTSTCRNTYGNIDGSKQICAGYASGGADACQGDSGGPLVVDSANGKLLVGVVSYGAGCARANAPGVYTRATGYLTWIESQTGVGVGTTGAAAAGSSTSTTTATTPSVPTSSTGDAGDNTGTARLVNLSLGDSKVINESLTIGDRDVFKLVVSQTGTISLGSTGTTDTVGAIFDSELNQLAYSDDVGSDRNFGIEGTLPAGTYYLLVQHYDAEGGSGFYGLSLRLQ